jgi:acetyltransferase-like isoleucine patch superfamily enzyme
MNEPKYKNVSVVDVKFGKNVTVINPVNLYGCDIGDDSAIGPFVEIQRGAVIGKRCRIQSHAFICDMVAIGDDCFISHGAMFINDPFSIGGPGMGKRELWRFTKIGSRVSIGTNATILPVTICDNVVIGAGSVVTKDISEPGIYAGNPARLMRKLPNQFNGSQPATNQSASRNTLPAAGAQVVPTR